VFVSFEIIFFWFFEIGQQNEASRNIFNTLVENSAKFVFNRKKCFKEKKVGFFLLLFSASSSSRHRFFFG